MTPSAVVAHANLRSLSLALLLALGLGWTLLCDAAGKTTVCSITVNSSNEKDAFQRNLPKDKYQFVELLERGRRDWFPAACEQHVQCDVLVISGHFGGDAAVHAESATEFYSDQVGINDSLPVEAMERASCSASCPGLFSHLKEVYLFGCETLSAQESQASSADVARSLVRAGYSTTDADRVSRLLSERHGESNRDRMRRIFAGVPAIYGFSSVAPLGPAASTLIDRYFHSGARSEVGDGRVSQRFLAAFSGHNATVTSGITAADPQAGYRRDVCTFLDDRLEAAQKLAFIRGLLNRDMIEVRMFFERIEAFLATVTPEERQSPSFREALADLAGDAAARDRYIAFSRKSVASPLRARMIKVAHDLGWYSDEEQRAETLHMVRELMASNSMNYRDVGVVCTASRDSAIAQELQSLQVAPGDPVTRTAGLACIGHADARASMLQALTSLREDDVQTAQVYLAQRPIVDAGELRALAGGIARMQRSPLQVRALQTFGQQRISDQDSLDELARLFPKADSVDVQRAIAGIFLLSDYRDTEKPALVRMLRQHRLKSSGGADLIDVLIRRWQRPDQPSEAAAYTRNAPSAPDAG